MNRLYSLMLMVLLLCLAVPQKLKAQNTLVTEISEPYLAKLIDAAKANQPRIKSLNNRVNIAQGNISRAKLSYLDALTFSYVYQPNSTFNLNALQTTAGTDVVGTRTGLFKGTQFGVFFNLGSYLQKPYAVKQAKQELIITNNDIQDALITLTTQIKKRYYIYLQKVASLKLQMQAASDADNVMRDIKYKFQKGEETLDSYNKARISHTQQIQTKITAEADLFMAKADLEEIIGDKLENIK